MPGKNALSGLTATAGMLTTRDGEVVGQLMASDGIAEVNGGSVTFSAAEIFDALLVGAKGEVVATDTMTVA